MKKILTVLMVISSMSLWANDCTISVVGFGTDQAAIRSILMNKGYEITDYNAGSSSQFSLYGTTQLDALGDISKKMEFQVLKNRDWVSVFSKKLSYPTGKNLKKTILKEEASFLASVPECK